MIKYDDHNSHTLSVPRPSACQRHVKPAAFRLQEFWGGEEGEILAPIKVSLEAQSVCQVASNI